MTRERRSLDGTWDFLFDPRAEVTLNQLDSETFAGQNWRVAAVPNLYQALLEFLAFLNEHCQRLVSGNRNLAQRKSVLSSPDFEEAPSGSILPTRLSPTWCWPSVTGKL
jgi:hypothetical protein